MLAAASALTLGAGNIAACLKKFPLYLIQSEPLTGNIHTHFKLSKRVKLWEVGKISITLSFQRRADGEHSDYIIYRTTSLCISPMQWLSSAKPQLMHTQGDSHR